jgi:hypothetical protein
LTTAAGPTKELAGYARTRSARSAVPKEPAKRSFAG